MKLEKIVDKSVDRAVELGKEAHKLELEEALWRKIDWIKLLSRAIENRPTSWNKEPVREWRNASDEIRSALIHELELLNILENPLDRARKELKERGVIK